MRAGRPVFSDRHQGRDGHDLIQQGEDLWLRSVRSPATEDGSFAGVIKTLNLSVKARLVVAEKDSEKSPDLRALVGNIEIGAAPGRRSPRRRAGSIHSLKLDDPSLPRSDLRIASWRTKTASLSSESR